MKSVRFSSVTIIQGLLDNGADISCIRASMAKKQEINLEVKVADGSRITGR